MLTNFINLNDNKLSIINLQAHFLTNYDFFSTFYDFFSTFWGLNYDFLVLSHNSTTNFKISRIFEYFYYLCAVKKNLPQPPKKTQLTESSRMILQGYDLTTAKYKANLYQKRMMLAVASAAQSKIDGVRHIAGQRFKIEEGEFPIISVPIDLILQDDDSSNIFAVRKAAKDFIGRVIEYQAADGSWVVFSLS